MLRQGSVLAVMAALGALAAGCSSDEGSGSNGGTSGSGGSGATGGSSGSGGSAGSAGSGGGGTNYCLPMKQKCPGPGYHQEYTAQTITDLSARVTDLGGNPAAQIQATVCGTDLCIFGSTDDQGKVVTCDQDLGVCTDGIQPSDPIKKPAFKFAQGFSYVKWAIPLPAGATHALGDVATAKFPELSTGAAFGPGQDATSSGVLLSVPAGGEMQIDCLTFETTDQHVFRAVEIPVNQAPAIAQAEGFVQLVGTTPVDTHFCPPAKLSIPNSASLPAGTAVEFWAHGVDTSEEYAPYAGWAKVSDGAVSSDGSAIVTSDGQGVHQLTVFGIKQK